MKCRAEMNKICVSAPASTTPRDIYEHAIKEWHKDNRCDGPFPKNFENFEKTLRDLQRCRFGTDSVEGVKEAHEKPSIMEGLERSFYGERGPLFNEIRIHKEYSNCIFSSPHSIKLIKKYMDVHERFFLMDGTFRITPKGVFKQVLVIYVRFGIKVFS